MTAAAIGALIAVGLSAGFVSGLVGIGGGVLMVPLLYLYYATPGWSSGAVAPELHAVVAHATSLFVIVPTALRGTFVYHRSGLVDWRVVVPMAAGSVAAAVTGARIALSLPGPALKVGFGIFLVTAGAQLLARRPRTASGEMRTGWPVLIATGLATGFLSALMGVGGGLVAIPILIYVVKMPLERVAATSLAVVAFAATAGVATYVASGIGTAGTPPRSLGYVDILAGLPILLGALVSVKGGVWVNRRLRTEALRRLFGVSFMAVGVQLVVTNLSGLV